ncbi:MAG: gamma-glutamyl-gamma-aminobutyrate hydrolase family protein [Actinomycetota bacterium]|nr:gamma-glutamyl-gamma-aminobutyrate hydrolase family protein [Actinomycetota bacterium]
MNGCAVGISAAIERARWGPWDQEVALAPRSYARAVQEAGGLALLLPPDDAAEAALERWLDRIDALLLSGGNDIDPAFYGQQPHPETKGIRPERDRFEIALTRGALKRRMPVLGICRGMELFNVARGGDLVQHLPDLVGNDEHRVTRGAFGDHEVRLAPGSLAARAVGAERTTIKSHHHQGMGALGEGLIASGWSMSEDVVEAIELDEREHPFALGVLWHPEEERSRVVGALIEAGKVKA